jgi:cell surface protein SprA
MVRLSVVCCCITGALSLGAASEGVRPPAPVIGFFHALSEEPASPSLLSVDNPALLECKTTLFEDREVVNFEKREIYFERADKLYNVPVWQYHYDELDAYLESRRHFVLLNAWYKGALSLLSGPVEKKKNPFTALQWELPVQYPAWAQRILGKDPPKLSISGFEKIIISYDNTKTDIPGSAVQIQPNSALVFDQDNQFSITGSVGRLIGINIKGSTKQAASMDVQNNPLKNFKIDYKGEGDELEDEVVQSVTAGFTGFDMPSTVLSGYSESHEGLFGIKIGAKVGPLSLTGIASTEQGETQSTTLHPSGQGDAGTVIHEKDFLRNKFFFLDTAYLSNYIGLGNAVPPVDTLQVWISRDGLAAEAALSNANRQTAEVYRNIGQSHTLYKLLKENRDYVVKKDQGYIRFDSLSVQDNDVLGIFMVTNGGAGVHSRKGANYLDTTKLPSTRPDLWPLKFRDQDSLQDTTYRLMWRNVYQMPSGFDPSKFRLHIVTVQDTSVSKAKNGRFFSEILGLTNDKGDPLATTTQIYDVDHGLIILPVRFKKSLTTGGLGNEPFSNDSLGNGDFTNPNIYRMTATSQDWQNIINKYQLMMSGSSRKTTFTLGFGSLMPGTEALYMGGKGGSRLDRNVDYTIDYQMGQIDLLSKRAQMADQIYVEYQSDALFVPQTKVFLGARGEVKLPFGEKSFMGTSVLWQNASSRDRVPKINQEPYSKLLLDFNTQIDLEPEWMTKVVNMLPLVTTDAKSAVNLEVEVAHSITNPNTDGSAYVDDFEGSKQTYPMGLTQGTWYQSSPPAPWQPNSDDPKDDSLLHHPPAWIQYWYAPAGDSEEQQVNMFDTLTHQLGQTQADKYEPTLNFVCQPAPPQGSKANDSLFSHYENPWAGIMAYFPSGTSDRSKDKYLEFWAKNDGGGRMYVDLGDVSESVSLDGGPPDDTLHTEDPTNTGNLTQDTLDKGLDGRWDQDERYLVPNAAKTGWDTLWYWRLNADKTRAQGSHVWDTVSSTRVLDSILPILGDPSKDDYHPYDVTRSDEKGNYRYVDGTEKNGLLNTEDLNGDGFRTTENFYRRYIDFDSSGNASFLKANAGNYRVNDTTDNANIKPIADTALRWHLYRIPLNDTVKGLFQKVGSPQWNQIKYVRIWWSNFRKDRMSATNSIRFARIQFVGNQWLEAPNVSADSSSELKLAVSTVNTDDNAGNGPGAYQPPPGVYRAPDDKGNQARESSLDLTYNNITPGTKALVRRSLSFQPLNLSAYSDLSVMVHGDSTRSGFWFFLRFGTDDSTYYEARAPIEAGWQTIDMKLKDISDMKLLYQITHGDTGAINTSVQTGNVVLSAVAPRGVSPNFANISFMAIGVYRDSAGFGAGWHGDLWVDEMKVGGIRSLDGWAARVNLSTKWADFLNLSVGVDYQDGNFRRMTETSLGLGNSQLSANFSVDGKLSKFLPDRWNVDIPLGMRLQESLTRPELMPSSDIYLLHKDGTPDGLLEMYQDAINMFLGKDIFHRPDTTASRHYQTMSAQRDWWTGFNKKGQSANPFINLLLERTAVDFAASHKTSETARGELTPGGEDMLDKDTLDTYHSTLKYNLTPTLEPKYYKFKPFEKSKLLWLPQQIKNYEFSYLPTTLTFDVAEVTYSKETSIKGETNDTTQLKKLELDHRMNLVYDPINILDFSYNLAVSRNLDSQITGTGIGNVPQAYSFLREYITKRDPAWGRYEVLYGERSRTQGTSLRFDPTFLDWFSDKFEYSANYHAAASAISGDTTHYQSIGMDRTFHLSSTLTLASLFKNFADGFASYKAMAKVFNSISAAITKINFNSVTFDYSAKSSLRNDNMSPDLIANLKNPVLDFYKYQVGLSGASAWNVVTGNMDDHQLGGMKFRPSFASTLAQNDQRTSDMNFTLSTNFNLPEPVDIQFTGISLGWSRNYIVRPDTTAIDTTTTWPDFTESARTGILNKITLVKQYLQGVNVSDKYSYQKKVHTTSTSSSTGREVVVSNTFAPLVGLEGTLKKYPVSFNYSMDMGFKTDTSVSTGSVNASRSTDFGHRAGIKYEISKSTGVSQLKLLMWTIPIVGRLVTGAEGEYHTSTTVTTSNGIDNTALTSSISATPHASYDFTDNITGELKYSYTQKKDPNSTTTSNIFSLSVEIRFNP